MNPANFNPVNHVGPLPSPCTSICQMNAENGFCKGCWRTLDEIMNWSVASEAKKMQVWLAISQRRLAA
jgi:predicted Fe-S protein YdhL (DUF1289 family)